MEGVSEQIGVLQTQKELLTIQKELLDLKSQIASLAKVEETPAEAAAESEEEGSAPEEEAAEEEEGTEEALKGFSSYLAEITAYEILKITAKKIGDELSKLNLEVPSESEEMEDRTAKILVLSEQCLLPHCLPLSDLALHQTRKQIEIIENQVENQIKVFNSLRSLPVTIKTVGEDWSTEEEDEPTEGDQGKDDKPTLAKVIASFLSGWGTPVAAASELVKGVGGLVGQLAASVTFQEQDISLSLEALIHATVDFITNGDVHLLSLGRIYTTEAAEDSVLAKLDQLIKRIKKLEEKRIRLSTEVVNPLNSLALEKTIIITKIESKKDTLAVEIAATKKRIGELKVKKQHETDPVKKTALQKEINLEAPGLKLLQDQLTNVDGLLTQERMELDRINFLLARFKTEVEVATNLAKTFNTFFEGITTQADKTALSPLALTVLREYVSSFNYLLRLSIHSGDGETITRKFLMLESRRLVGGCAVSYTLTTVDGRVLKSGLEVFAGQRKFNFTQTWKMILEKIPTFEA